jgi:phosphatidylglycerophosphatase A
MLFFFALCWLPLWAYVGITSMLFLAGIWLCGRTAAALAKEDPQEVVWDEIVGFLVAMTAVAPSWPWLAGAFTLFRVFDIFKPWPISLVDRRIPGGLGIMLDDLLAGLYTLAVLHSVRWGLM